MSETEPALDEALSDNDDKASPSLGMRIARLFHFFVESGMSESEADALAVEMEGDIELENTKPH